MKILKEERKRGRKKPVLTNFADEVQIGTTASFPLPSQGNKPLQHDIHQLTHYLNKYL